MKTLKHAPPARPEPIGPKPDVAMAIDIQPYAPGRLLLSIPIGLILTEAHAVTLLAQIHNALDQLRKLTAGPNGKTSQGAKRGIAAGKRKR